MRRAGPEVGSVKKRSSGVSARTSNAYPGPPNGKRRAATRLAAMGSWYWIGVAAGIGTAAGMAIATLVPVGRAGAGIAAVLGAGAGLGLGLLVGDWIAAAVGAVGGALGALSAVPVVANAVRGGGTRLGIGVWVIV